jgi:hypothetical protein
MAFSRVNHDYLQEYDGSVMWIIGFVERGRPTWSNDVLPSNAWVLTRLSPHNPRLGLPFPFAIPNYFPAESPRTMTFEQVNSAGERGVTDDSR